MTVYTGAVKAGFNTLQSLLAAVPDLEKADTLSVAAIDKALRDLNAEIDARVAELDDEIAGDAGLSAFGLISGGDAALAAAQLGLEAENVDQMTHLLDARAYTGRIDRLMDQVR